MSSSNGSKFDPRVPQEYSLACHAEFPYEARPVFVFRRTSAAEWSVITAEAEAPPEENGADYIFRIFCIGLIGWRNQVDTATGEPVEFQTTTAPQDCRRLISIHEATSLLEQRNKSTHLQPEEKKSSG